VPVKYSLRLARGDLIPAFFCRAKAVAGHWGADLMAGGFGGGACCTRAGLRRRQCSPPTVWIEFSARCVCVLSCFYVQLPICSSGFTRIFFVRGLIVILVKFEILHM
jgi:hypothetical protein